MGARLSAEERMDRGQRFLESSELLLQNGDEWAAVTYFYSAYQSMKAAIESDPVFQSVSRLARINVHLTPAAQFSKHHKGSLAAGRPYGVNDVVRLLYPHAEIYARYLRLHRASVAVRYESGLGPIRLESLRDDARFIRSAVSNNLRCQHFDDIDQSL